MATVTHTIYSHYDPKDRKKLERETGQLTDELEAAASWVTEPPKYRRPGAPRFVAATSACDTWDIIHASSSRQKLNHEGAGIGSETVNWYRFLRGSLVDEEAIGKRASSALAQSSSSMSSEKRDKNNWIIMNAMNTTQSEPLSSRATSKLKAPTLADILARDPPPKPNERKYTPPVWLEIGPGNKGFAMLQKSGWSEGEPLGPDIVRRKRATDEMGDDLFAGKQARVRGKDKGKGRRPETPLDANQVRPKEVIDLTWSDSDSDGGHVRSSVNPERLGVAAPVVKSEFVERERTASRSVSLEPQEIERGDETAYGRRALLTPLATTLKSDRLGIGLKAKTVGPYKESKKRVTHNAAALAAHIRGAEELRKRKKKLGRGRKGFEREYKKGAMKREMMLAYMNS
ncbi:hypothetical protein AX14_012401 [Amanita brunnescens Koide BX004]|nr:hypothetical protein AX14_012401 [Amanita brunnescens Koide BX004]